MYELLFSQYAVSDSSVTRGCSPPEAPPHGFSRQVNEYERVISTLTAVVCSLENGINLQLCTHLIIL